MCQKEEAIAFNNSAVDAFVAEAKGIG